MVGECVAVGSATTFSAVGTDVEVGSGVWVGLGYGVGLLTGSVSPPQVANDRSSAEKRISLMNVLFIQFAFGS